MSRKTISIVIPVFNEEENIPLLYNALSQVLEPLTQYVFEVIFVDDGSRDKTWKTIQAIRKHDSMVRGIRLSRNFGHPSALEAGLEQTAGDAVVMMDGDLQHPAELVPDLISKWEEGFKIVNSIRLKTKGEGTLKHFTSTTFYKLMNYLSSVKINDGEADFRLLDRAVVDQINKLPEKPKFYRGLVHWLGYEIAYIEYEAPAREHGKSSFSPGKMLSLARLGLTSFSIRPLQLIIGVGFVIFSVSSISLLLTILVKTFNYEYFSNTFVLVLLILVMTGLLICFQGVTALYLIDIFNAALGRPSYIIAEKTEDTKSKQG